MKDLDSGSERKKKYFDLLKNLIHYSKGLFLLICIVRIDNLKTCSHTNDVVDDVIATRPAPAARYTVAASSLLSEFAIN